MALLGLKPLKIDFLVPCAHIPVIACISVLSPPPPPKKKKHNLSDANMHPNVKATPKNAKEVQEEPEAEHSGDIILDQVKVKDEVIEENCDETGTISAKTVVTKSKQNIPVIHKVPMDKPLELDFDADTALTEEAEKHIEENEQFIIELLSKTQPHHDHSYTTIFGSRKGSEVIHHLIDESDEENEETKATNNTVIYLDKKGNKTKPNVKPILFLRHRSPNENVPMVSKEEVISEQGVESDGEDDDFNRLLMAGPYVDWMPWQSKIQFF